MTVHCPVPSLQFQQSWHSMDSSVPEIVDEVIAEDVFPPQSATSSYIPSLPPSSGQRSGSLPANLSSF